MKAKTETEFLNYCQCTYFKMTSLQTVLEAIDYRESSLKKAEIKLSHFQNKVFVCII